MLPPIPRCSGWVSSSLISPSRISLPRYGSRVGLHIVLFEACSAFTRVAACTLALSPNRDTLIEGFSHFVTSMTAPIASGWSESPGGACTHWKAPPCHGARQLPTSGQPPLTTRSNPRNHRAWVTARAHSGPCPGLRVSGSGSAVPIDLPSRFVSPSDELAAEGRRRGHCRLVARAGPREIRAGLR